MIYLTSAIALGLLLAALGLLLSLAERFLVNYGVVRVDINDEEVLFETDGGQTLLSSLYEQGVFIPSACGGKGSCGFCKVRVRSGGGPVLPTETPFLSRLEVRQGVRLACQLKLKEDVFVRIPEELLNVKMFQARIAETTELTHDIRGLTFELTDPAEISFRPGQYVQIEAPSPEGPIFRAYSISSPVSQADSVELMVRLVPNGIASTYLHSLVPGDSASFTGPYGEFVLSEDPEVEIVCVGGGVGMAPIRNIVLSLYERWPDRTCWLFFGCRGVQDIFCLDEFRELERRHPSFRAVYALSDPLGPDDQWDGETGFIHLAVDKLLSPGVRRQAFLCGPPPMIAAVTEVLEANGLDEQDIFYDKF